MEAIALILSGAITVWAIRSICYKQQSNAKKILKSLLAAWYFLGFGLASRTTAEFLFISIPFLLIGFGIIAYSNYKYRKSTSSNEDIFRGYKEAKKAFESEEEKKTKNSYRETNFVKKSTSTELTKVAFNYVNSKGEEKFRDVDIKSYDGHYLEGYCHSARRFRTFIQSRIDGDIIVRDTGESLDPYEWAAMLETQ